MGNVTSMNSMFYDAVNFNQDISNWDTAKVKYMNKMFFDARNFNQNIGQWNIESLEEAGNMFWVGFTTESYSQLLIGWAKQNVKQNVAFGAYSSTYWPNAAAAREYLISQSWKITDNGEKG